MDMAEIDVERWMVYCDRGPRDVVVSGPLEANGWGPGVLMPDREAAWNRLVAKYGESRVRNHPQSFGRWGFLIRNLRSA